MIDIERVILMRAEEQMACSFHNLDRGEDQEPAGPECCEVCSKPVEARRNTGGRPLPNRARICKACHSYGYRGRRCECGKPLHRRDYSTNDKSLRRPSMCGVCRKAARMVAA